MFLNSLNFFLKILGWQGQWRGKDGDRRDGKNFGGNKFGDNREGGKNASFFREIAEFIISRGIIYIYIPAMYFIFSLN